MWGEKVHKQKSLLSTTISLIYFHLALELDIKVSEFGRRANRHRTNRLNKLPQKVSTVSNDLSKLVE